ncbi:MAG: hypothetical protein K2W93_09800 [Burkholderiaceae bacterium]|nr:hypothetical protein [Burkholderiaceae bacterium]
MKVNPNQLAALAVGALAVGAAFYLVKNGVAGAAAGVVGAAGEAASGAVLGLGDVLGIPRTDPDKYRQAIAAGDAWNASFYGTGFGSAMALAQSPVVAIGDLVGVPRINETECERAKREGRTLDASFKCEASDFLKYLFN